MIFSAEIVQTRELGSITYYSKIIIAISVPSYFRLSSGMVSGKMIIVTFFLSLKPIIHIQKSTTW